MTRELAKRLGGKKRWLKIRHWVMGLFMLLVVVLIIIAASSIDWFAVLTAIHKLPTNALVTAVGLTMLGYLACGSFDVLGKIYTHHALANWRVMLTGFISYAFTMNLGSPVGVSARLRLYNKQGLSTGIALRVMALSVTTNWLGYLLLAGFVFMSGSVRLPVSWVLGDGVLRLMGVGMVLISLVYLWLCAFSRRRSWHIWGQHIALPSLNVAVMQFGLAMFSWLVIASIIYVLLQQKFAFPVVLGVLLISAVAGLLVRIPGGIGVTEWVFITLLPGLIPVTDMLGGLLAYRAIYYVGPMLLAGLMYFGIEAGIKKHKQHPRH
ncbi:MAG: UPF0104 family protein [Burkholderiaceae bacterium]|nr:UPF0104 family protein [Burkholderiaceae bacterium]